jgi:glycosyltransferase involved in cell wall biosynthesis
MLLGSARALYAAFDAFPTRKGASIHISHAARCLFGEMGGGLLYALGGVGYPLHQLEDTIEIVRFFDQSPNLLTRTVAFGRRLERLLGECEGSLEICQFRDPWSGVPILRRRGRYVTVFEVNGLPSIELPYVYPLAAPATLDKIRTLEKFCLDTADWIVTPSATTRDLLVELGADRDRISLIPNGADVPPARREPRPAEPRYLLYFGALQAWQGLDTLIRAFARLLDIPDLRLVMCASSRSRDAKYLIRLAERLGITDRVDWKFGLSEEELTPWRANATLAVAPLRACSRNVRQGCSPLKILESMAAGVPVVASDLPPVREIITDGVDGRLVAPDRPSDLARAIRVLLDHPADLGALGEAARRRIETSFTWHHHDASLQHVYRSIAGPSRHRAAPSRAGDAGTRTRAAAAETEGHV